MPVQPDLLDPLVPLVQGTGRAGMLAFAWLWIRAVPGRFSGRVDTSERRAVNLYAAVMGVHLATLAALWASGEIEAPLPRIIGGGLAYAVLMLGPLLYGAADPTKRWFGLFRNLLLGYPMFVYLVTYVGRVQAFAATSTEGLIAWSALALLTMLLGWRTVVELTARRRS